MARRSILPHDRAILALTLLGGLPGIALALVLLWFGSANIFLRWTAAAAAIGCWIALAAAVRRRVVAPLQTMANVLLALRQGDYSFRAAASHRGDALGDILGEINSLGAVLQTQRRGAVEAATLLRTVIEEMDVAFFAFDQAGQLRLANRAGEKLLRQPADGMLGRSARSLGLADCLEGPPNRLLPPNFFPEVPGRWSMRRSPFREQGRPHQLVVITNLIEPLREEELKAWQVLVRVLGHELNNSLAPIKSIAGSLATQLRRHPRPPEWEEDLRSGLDVIATRAESLARFLQSYSQLARLPPPTLSACFLADLVQRVVTIESRLPVELRGGSSVTIRCDGTQIEQVLINLVRNAVDAALEERAAGRSEAGVRLAWSVDQTEVIVRVEDDGPGLAQTANLFVPFFTTKRDGSGIGLVLCRRIAENHGGSLELANRRSGVGCTATLRLPLGK